MRATQANSTDDNMRICRQFSSALIRRISWMLFSFHLNKMWQWFEPIWSLLCGCHLNKFVLTFILVFTSILFFRSMRWIVIMGSAHIQSGRTFNIFTCHENILQHMAIGSKKLLSTYIHTLVLFLNNLDRSEISSNLWKFSHFASAPRQ